MENGKKKKNEIDVETEDQKGEINPDILDPEEIHFDLEGEENSKAHQPYEF